MRTTAAIRGATAALAVLVFLSGTAVAGDDDLPELSLEALMSVEVTSASKREWTLDFAAYHVDELPNLAIDSYTRVDLRAAWSRGERLELSLALQNLLDDEHGEFVDFLVQPVLVERSAVATVTWKFS